MTTNLISASTPDNTSDDGCKRDSSWILGSDREVISPEELQALQARWYTPRTNRLMQVSR